MNVLEGHGVRVSDTTGLEWLLGMVILTLKMARRHVVLRQVDLVDHSVAARTATWGKTCQYPVRRLTLEFRRAAHRVCCLSPCTVE